MVVKSYEWIGLGFFRKQHSQVDDLRSV